MTNKDILNHPTTRMFGKNMYHHGHNDGCHDGIAIVLWVLHEKYGWNKVLGDLADESIEFINEFMKHQKTNVTIKDIKESLKDECGLCFEG